MLTIDTARVFEPLTKPSRYKGAWGGRGSGKSHLGPSHDRSSHAADAFGLMAIAYEEPSRTASMHRKIIYPHNYAVV
jgi:hypothetical protein